MGFSSGVYGLKYKDQKVSYAKATYVKPSISNPLIRIPDNLQTRNSPHKELCPLAHTGSHMIRCIDQSLPVAPDSD